MQSRSPNAISVLGTLNCLLFRERAISFFSVLLLIPSEFRKVPLAAAFSKDMLFYVTFRLLLTAVSNETAMQNTRRNNTTSPRKMICISRTAQFSSQDSGYIAFCQLTAASNVRLVSCHSGQLPKKIPQLTSFVAVCRCVIRTEKRKRYASRKLEARALSVSYILRSALMIITESSLWNDF